MKTVTLTIETTDGQNQIVSDKCLNFRFEKEAYTPYTNFSGRFSYSSGSIWSAKAVKVDILGKTVHYGLVDTLERQITAGETIVNISSKGFTSLLCQNQLEPGLKSAISLNSLMDSFITIPNVIHEDNSDTQNYIFVKDGSTLWDAVTNLCYKLNSSYPYIDGTNKVMISMRGNPVVIEPTNSQILKKGVIADYTKIISDYHMEGIDGNYNQYSMTNNIAHSHNIVRHKQITLDRQYLSNPSSALNYRINYSMRGYRSYYCEYNDYKFEDLNDKVTINGLVTEGHINRIIITGGTGDIKTRLYSYFDNYCN